MQHSPDYIPNCYNEYIPGESKGGTIAVRLTEMSHTSG